MGIRKGNGFNTLHHPPNHSNNRKSIMEMQSQQQPQSIFNGSNQRATSFMVHNTGGNIVNNANVNNAAIARINGGAFVSVDPITGQAVTYNANCTENVNSQQTYLSSSLSDGGQMFVDENGVVTANLDVQKRIAGDGRNGNIGDMAATPGEIVKQLLQQHRRNNQTNISSQQFLHQNVQSNAQPAVMNTVVTAQQVPMTNAGPVSLPQPQFAHPIASATAAKI